MHHSWWNDPLMVFGLHEYRPICRFEASAVKAMRPNPHTCILCPVIFLDFVRSPVHNTGCIVSQHVALASSLWCLSWCRSRHTWRWEARIVSSPRTSSRNHSTNFVFSKDSFLFCNSTLFLDVLTWDCCCRRCRRCCFSRKPGFTCIVKTTVSRCTLEDSSSFQRCSNLVHHTRAFPRLAWKIRKSVLPFRAMVNHNSQSTICQNSYKSFRNIQWWYLYWRVILNSFS